ncbi:hypothetical protein GJ744_008451 [Endocarpon pusillum]|uniref:Zn(2)-C6 fungal-type domain-containing protein n=1 Tax=Endocarpon pusillum TaxID=364733 RepID=A0A8H7AL21_9EURO|nr:hypothetical protein GJ744_008451 [Endocarpon pusillum]
MSAQTLVKRTRASVPRAKTGCSTCKVRHVKCGEERPECRRCVDSGRSCDGYEARRYGHVKPQCGRSIVIPTTTRVACPTPLAAITSYSIPFKIPGSQKDRQKLHYFCVQAASDLSGNLCSGSDFWSNTVLRCSHEEPVVRHALIALSSIHLDLVTTDCPEGQGFGSELTSVESLLQYNKAIRQLRTYLSSRERPSVKVALICCALFYCFESTRGEYDSALGHLQNGLSILRDAMARRKSEAHTIESKDEPEDLQSLEQFFIRLDLQATVFDEGRVPLLEFTSLDERTGIKPIVATDIFQNLYEAQLALDKLRNQAWRFCTINAPLKHVQPEELPAHVVQEKKQLVSQFKHWSSALEALWHQQDSDSCQRSQSLTFQESATMLKVLHRSAQMLILANFPHDYSIFGSTPNERGREIISLIESLRLTDPSRRTYSCEVGIIAPLSMLGSSCQDPQVCGKAMMLLAASKRREGLVDAQMVVRIARRILMLRTGGQVDVTPPVDEPVRQTADTVIDDMAMKLWVSESMDHAQDGSCAVPRIAKMFGSAVKLFNLNLR